MTALPGMIVMKRYLAVMLALWMVLTTPQAAVGKWFVMEKEGYGLMPPEGWETIGVGDRGQLQFRYDDACIMTVQTSDGVDVDVQAYAAELEKHLLKPGSVFERRTGAQEVAVNGYPGLVAEYSGTNGSVPMVYVRLPHQIVFSYLQCVGHRQEAIDQYATSIGSIRATPKNGEPSGRAQDSLSSLNQAGDSPAGTPGAFSPNPPGARGPGTAARPDLLDPKPRFRWE